ncbi:hypothetical protein HDR61_03875 [bacterium]|nr:hypothetical protein [bacterium]
MYRDKIKFLLQPIQLRIRSITGKQDIIEEYNMLVSFFNSVMDTDFRDEKLKNYIIRKMDEITESAPIYQENAATTTSYDPYHSKRQTTLTKITKLCHLKNYINRRHNIKNKWNTFCQNYNR